jgi:DNA-directed RNA polymerase subunit RPC12/RpoP
MDPLIPIIPIVSAAILTVLFAFWQRWMSSTFDYQCANCGEIFSLPAWQAMLALHVVETKLVRCPNCGQMTWATPVRKGNGS